MADSKMLEKQKVKLEDQTFECYKPRGIIKFWIQSKAQREWNSFLRHHSWLGQNSDQEDCKLLHSRTCLRNGISSLPMALAYLQPNDFQTRVLVLTSIPKFPIVGVYHTQMFPWHLNHIQSWTHDPYTKALSSFSFCVFILVDIIIFLVVWATISNSALSLSSLSLLLPSFPFGEPTPLLLIVFLCFLFQGWPCGPKPNITLHPWSVKGSMLDQLYFLLKLGVECNKPDLKTFHVNSFWQQSLKNLSICFCPLTPQRCSGPPSFWNLDLQLFLWYGEHPTFPINSVTFSKFLLASVGCLLPRNPENSLWFFFELFIHSFI